MTCTITTSQWYEHNSSQPIEKIQINQKIHSIGTVSLSGWHNSQMERC